MTTRNDLANIIRKTNGKIFSATFQKKDGEIRKINCRLGVTKHLKGGKSTIAGKENLIGVYDAQNEGYRCINVDTLKEVKFGGVTYEVDEE